MSCPPFLSLPSALFSFYFSILLVGIERSIKIVSKHVLYLKHTHKKKIKRDKREPGVLRWVYCFVQDMVQRTSAGSPAQPEHKLHFGPSIVICDEYPSGITNRIRVKRYILTFRFRLRKVAWAQVNNKGDKGNWTWLKNAILDSSSLSQWAHPGNKQWSLLKHKRKKTFGGRERFP